MVSNTFSRSEVHRHFGIRLSDAAFFGDALMNRRLNTVLARIDLQRRLADWLHAPSGIEKLGQVVRVQSYMAGLH